MRDSFHENLEAITALQLKMAILVKDAIEKATTSLLTSDLALAEKVIEEDAQIDQIHHDLDERVIDLMARQQPVASDLRALVSAIRISADLERMGDLAHHLAKLARMRYPNSAVPAEFTDLIASMGAEASRITEKMTVVIEFRDTTRALEVEKDDDAMDQLQRKLIASLVDPDGKHNVETSIDMAFASRYYERFSDHAVSIAKRIYYIATGEFAKS
jgi:phosphate transport system protein